MDVCKTGIAVSTAEAGQKLLNFLRRRIDAPDNVLHRWIRTGQVRINGGRAKAFDRVNLNDIVRVPPFAVERRTAGVHNLLSPGESKPTGLPPVVYEDEEILVLAKPSGLAAQGGTGHDDSAAARVAQAFAEADFVPAPAHRLDRDTSGMLVFGKTYRSLRFLADAFAGRGDAAPHKYYLAWADGTWEGQPFELCDLLLRDKSGLMAVLPKDSPPKEVEKAVAARLQAVQLLSRCVDGKTRSLLLLRLITGRTHQIRVQLSARGHPVSGDPWYGSGGDLKLHAFRITLPKLDGSSLNLFLAPPWENQWRVPSSVLDTAKNMHLDHVKA